MINLNNFKSILCLNGDLPDASFFTGTNKIIAADGAATKLQVIGINPDVIIGDLDSVYGEFPNSLIIEDPSQCNTDFEKALNYINKNHPGKTLVLGANGGFLDHILNNINIIIENELTFYSKEMTGFIIKGPGHFTTNLNFNSKISLFGISKAIVSTSGLKWELNEELLEFPGKNSSLNRVVAEEVNINVVKGKLLIMIYNMIINDQGTK